MNFDNATIYYDGARTIGIKGTDKEKFEKVENSKSSFEVNASVSDVSESSGGTQLEEKVVNEPVLNNNVMGESLQAGVENVPASETETVSEPNIFDNPVIDVPAQVSASQVVYPEAPQLEQVPVQSVQQIQTPSMNPVQLNASQDVTGGTQPVNMFDVPTAFEDVKPQAQPEVVVPVNMYQQPAAPSNLFDQNLTVSTDSLINSQPEPAISMPSYLNEKLESLDTPQTFYEKQDSQETQGGFSNNINNAITQQQPSFDPALIMLDEVRKTVDDRRKLNETLQSENQKLNNKINELVQQNAALTQRVMELNNKIVEVDESRKVAVAQRDAAQQALTNARMAESVQMVNDGPVRTYQPQPQMQPQPQQFYQNAA